LPPARASSASWVSADITGRLPRLLINCDVSASESGASESVMALRVAPAQP
jgi:hypothetical protein